MSGTEQGIEETAVNKMFSNPLWRLDFVSGDRP